MQMQNWKLKEQYNSTIVHKVHMGMKKRIGTISFLNETVRPQKLWLVSTAGTMKVITTRCASSMRLTSVVTACLARFDSPSPSGGVPSSLHQLHSTLPLCHNMLWVNVWNSAQVAASQCHMLKLINASKATRSSLHCSLFPCVLCIAVGYCTCL